MRDVTISYRRRPVIENMTANASNGELVGLVGPNGSGKTTLLRFLSGLIKGDSGSIVYGETEIDTDSRRWRSELSFVPDDGGTIALLTVEEQLLLQCQLTGIDPNESVNRVECMIDVLRLGNHRNYASNELSTGLRKRLGIGLGIIRDAGVYLFDEPFTSLDVHTTEIFYGILTALKKSGKITVVATHSFPLRSDICNRIWDLSTRGRASERDPGSYLEPGAAREVVIPWFSRIT